MNCHLRDVLNLLDSNSFGKLIWILLRPLHGSVMFLSLFILLRHVSHNDRLTIFNSKSRMVMADCPAS